MQDPALFQAIGSKMKFLQQRQTLISGNIANANTPNYKPLDLTPVDFGRVLDKVLDNSGRSQVRLAATRSGHVGANELNRTRSDEQDETYEVTPSGNAVILEEQSVKAGQTQGDYALMTAIYRKNAGMLMTALGRNS